MNNEITYVPLKNTEYKKNHVKVCLEGMHVGTIKPVLHLPEGKRGFQYFVKGCNSKGEVFDTIEQVKTSLEDVS